MSYNPDTERYSANSQTKIDPTQRLDFLSAIAMDHDILAKESMALRVAVVMLKHRHNQTGLIVLKHKTIAAEIGCSVAAVRRAIDILAERDWFGVEHQYVYGEYTANKYVPRWDRLLKSDAQIGGQVCSITSSPLLDNEQTSVQQRADLCSVTSNHQLRDSNSEIQPRDSNPVPNASRQEGPAESISGSQGSDSESATSDEPSMADGALPPASNDNQPEDENTARYREAAELGWEKFQKAPRKERPEFIRQFVALCRSGEIRDSKSFMFGIEQMQNSRSGVKYHTRPIEFLEKRMWLDYRSGNKPKRRVAI